MEGKLKIKIYLGIIAALLGLNICAWKVAWDLYGNRYLTVDFLNVGQGDAVLIKTPTQQQILIDGGPNSKVLQELSKEMPFYDRTIDLVILSHPEKDHLAGLLGVLSRYKVKNILWSGVVRDTEEWQEWADMLKKEGAVLRIAKAGDRVILKNENPRIFIDILSPQKSEEGKVLGDSNDSSIVALLMSGVNSFLFTGDIGAKIEGQLASEDIKANVLKVAHHGSKYSSSDSFLESVLPEIAVISVGQNDYGHPTSEVLAKLENFGINVLRTDLNGSVKIYSDGNNLKLIKNH